MANIIGQFNFKHDCCREGGSCGLTVIEKAGKAIVILTELADNPGPSVTHAFGIIATQVYHKFLASLPADRITWIEHYDKGSYPNSEEGYQENFAKVTITWDPRTRTFDNDSEWRHCSAQELMALGIRAGDECDMFHR